MVALKSARLWVGSFVFCVVSPWSFAVRAQTCEKNEDCGANMVCFEQKLSTCSGGASTQTCGQNEKCEAPEPAQTTCTEAMFKSCLPRYLLPCEANADCGDGFTCEPNMECSCSGSGGSSGSAAGPRADAGTAVAEDAGASYKAAFAAPVPPKPAADGGVVGHDGGSVAPTCECHPLEQKHCVARSIPCQSDTECPSDFTCLAQSTGAVDCALSKDADAAVCGAATQTTEEKLCAPRYSASDADGGIARGGSDDSGHGPVTLGSSNDKGTSEPPQSEGASDAGAPQQDAGAMPESDHSNCSVTTLGAGHGSGAVTLSFVLLALGLSTRKRARR